MAARPRRMDSGDLLIMAIFKAQPIAVSASAEAVFDKLSDLSSIKTLMGNIPESAVPDDQRQLLEEVEITDNSIAFPAGPVGKITLEVAERIRPTLIRLEGVGTPVALSLSLEIAPLSDSSCEAATAIDIAIPPMLKPMIGGTLQKMADQFTEVLGKLNYD